MGYSLPDHRIIKMLRIVLVACCAALAAAEADADALYGSYGYHGLGYSRFGYAAPAVTHGYAAPVAHATWGYAAPVAAHAAYGYAAPAQGAAIAVRGYGTPATVGSTLPYGYAASGRYVADSVGAVHVAKREAEADADALYRTYGYRGYGYGGYTTLGYRGLGYTRSYGLGYGYPYYG